MLHVENSWLPRTSERDKVERFLQRATKMMKEHKYLSGGKAKGAGSVQLGIEKEGTSMHTSIHEGKVQRR